MEKKYQLSQQIAALNQQVSEILAESEPSLKQYPEILSESLEELNVALEELQISQDELQQQNLALSAATEEVAIGRQRYQNLFELAPDSYLVTDAGGIILEANQATATLLQVNQDYLIGKPIAVFIAVDDRQSFRRELNQLHRVDRRQEWEVCLLPRNSLPLNASITVATTFDEDGNLTEMRWLLRDLTQRQQLEEAQLKVKLTEMVNQELATEITQRQQLEDALRQQADALGQASRMKDEFLAIVSHELRSPLNPILGWSELLHSRKLSGAEVERALDAIRRNARLQAQLIDDLLDISRIIQGKIHLSIQPVPLAGVLENAIEAVQLSAIAKATDLQISADSSLLVSGDPARLQQVIWNLLSNAIKFTPKQGKVTVQLQQEDAEVVLTVSDTGCGISPDLLPYLFDRFWQAEKATTRSHGGLGLGLAIARHLIEMHGGTIQATSAGSGQGASFTIRLPLQTNASTNLPSPPAAASTLENLHVLVVDDQADARDILKTTLEQAGAIVTAVGSAELALQAIQSTQFDLLVSDIAMPEQDGYDLLRQIRTHQSGDRLPAIALTAYATEACRQRALATGFQAHLPKPIEPVKLVALVATEIKKIRDR